MLYKGKAGKNERGKQVSIGQGERRGAWPSNPNRSRDARGRGACDETQTYLATASDPVSTGADGSADADGSSVPGSPVSSGAGALSVSAGSCRGANPAWRARAALPSA